MSAPRNDGGPAFPVLEPGRQGFADVPTKSSKQHLGLSLRDYFAGQALMGFLSAVGPHQPYSADPADIAAKRAYEYADALIAERDRQP